MILSPWRLLFLVQVLVGGATAHYRADPAAFYGVDISGVFPSHILRTWHLQLAILWIATSYIAGGLLLAPAVGNMEPRRQAAWINLLFAALVVVVAGSLVGEALGVNQMLGKLWFWFGHQGWEYLDLGRAWQVLLAAALALWLRLLFKAIGPARKDPQYRWIFPHYETLETPAVKLDVRAVVIGRPDVQRLSVVYQSET